MKQLIFSAFICLLASISFAQNFNSKVYKSEVEHFSFAYPSYLEKQKIDNAPHMLLKLDSDNFSLTLSLADHGFGRSVSIWDEDVVNYYSETERNFLNPQREGFNSQIEKSCEKIYLTINNDVKIKCLKSVIRTNLYIQGHSIKSKQIVYRLLHKGNLLMFVFYIYDFHNYWNKTQFSDDIMKGLSLF
jgi:hypothetical protein